MAALRTYNMTLFIFDEFYDFCEVFLRHFFLLGKEREHGFQGISEEGALHLLHHAVGVFLPGDEWLEHEGLAAAFHLARGDEPLVRQNLQERGDGGVGGLRLWVLLNDLMRGKPFGGDAPEDVHDFHLRLGERSLVFVPVHRHLLLLFTLQIYY